MNVNFAVTSPEGWVVKELNSRSENILNPSGSAWATQRKPWVRAISSALVGGDAGLRTECILWSGKLNSFANSYDSTYYRPKFGITSMDMDFKGTMGSTRSITLNFQCWTLEDLVKLEKVYMIPGMSIIVEWGWSLTSTGVPVNPVGAFANAPSPNDNYLSDIMKTVIANRLNYSGNYDGFIGVVTNFNYSLNQDLGFDCSIEIIGPGEMFLEESAINNSAKCKDLSERGKTKSNYEAEMHLIYRRGEKPEYVDKVNGDDGTTSIVQQRWEVATREYDKKKRGLLSSAGNGFVEFFNPNPEKTEVYISWAKFVRKFNGMLGKVKEDQASTAAAAEKPNAKGSNAKLGLDYIPVTVLPKFMSADPRICTFKPINVSSQAGESRQLYLEIKAVEPPEESPDEKQIKKDSSITEKVIETASDVAEATWTAVKKSFVILGQTLENQVFDEVNLELPEESQYPKGGLPNLTDISFAKNQILKFGDKIDLENESKNSNKIKSEPTVGFINNIFLNAGYLRDLLVNEENLSIEDFLSKVLNDLNECGGGLWNLQYAITDEDSGRLHIYDANYTSADARGNTITPYEFKLNQVSLLGVNVESKLVDGFKEMVLYDTTALDNGTNNASNLGGKLYADGIRDGFKFKSKSVEKCTPDPEATAAAQEDVEADLDAAYYLLIDAVDDESVSGAKNALKQYLKFLEEYKPATAKTLPRNNNLILPFNFNLSIDGFSGLIWGNAIKFDYLPNRYDNKIYFQITKIKHRLDPDQWVTELETIMRVKNTDTTADSPSTNTDWKKATNIRNAALDARAGSSTDVGAYRQTLDIYLNNPAMKIDPNQTTAPLPDYLIKGTNTSSTGPKPTAPKTEKPSTVKFDPSNPGAASVAPYVPGNR